MTASDPVLWHFLRHGEAVSNAEGWLAGHMDPALTERGRAQAHAARDQVAAASFDRVLCSDLDRARQTARIILGNGAEITFAPQLRERDCGEWAGRHFADQSDQERVVPRSWNGRPPGGESLRDTAVRVIDYLGQVEDGRDTLVVCHGFIIRAVLGVVDGTHPDAIGHRRPGNCELITRALPKGAWHHLAQRIP